MGRKKIIKGFDPEKQGSEYNESEGLPLPEHLNNEDGSLNNDTWLRGKNNKHKRNYKIKK